VKQYLKNLLKIPKLSQRGDSGTIYIVFIMVIIIGASYVMVNGLSIEFDDDAARQSAAEGSQFTEGPGNLPSLPPTGSQAYLDQKRCAEEALKGVSNKEIAKKGEVKADCPE
jgi:hypothetical protein